MKRLKVSLFAAALVLATGANARAAIGWGVDWTPTNTAVVMGTDPHYGPTIINFSNPGFNAFNNASSQTTASNLTLSTSNPGSSPFVVSQTNAQNFQVVAKVYDGTTNTAPSTNVTFTGKLWGSFSTGGVTTFSSWTTPTTQTVTFAGTGDKFTVSILSFSGPPVPGLKNNPGQIWTSITETPGSGPIQGNGAPEPSTMLMGCMGLSFLGFASWRKRVRRALAA